MIFFMDKIQNLVCHVLEERDVAADDIAALKRKFNCAFMMKVLVVKSS